MKTSVGNKLFALRKERGLTQLDMALLLDEPETTYARYERGESKVDYKKLIKFAEKLNVSLAEFLPETSSVNNTGANNSHSQGSGLILGNQYFYYGDSALKEGFARENEKLSLENQVLKEKLEALERKMEEILAKM